MFRKILLGAALPVLLAGALVLGGCGSSGGASVHPTWITPAVSGNTVSIPVASVQQDTIVHFYATTADGKESFMAYEYGGTTYLRADICVPCRSTSFSLQGNILVCDACGTRFNAVSGKGVSGACVSYSKAAAAFTISGGNMVMQVNDLKTAYSDTVNRITP